MTLCTHGRTVGGMSDHRLEAAVMTALADNVLVNADQIAVEVIGGRATLRGTVGTLLQRAEVVRTARDVPGIDGGFSVPRSLPVGACRS